MSELFQELKKADSLPTPPGVALEIIRLNRQEDVEIDEIAEVLTRDPAIVAKLLKTANSGAFGRAGKVADIRQAIMVLGLRSVNLMALSFSLSAASTGESKLKFDYARYWTLASVTTLASRLLADRFSPALRDQAFLAGLLCDFAQLVMAECAPTRYAPVMRKLAKSPEMALQDAEQEILGTDHAALGGMLLEEWGLPELVHEAVSGHHRPELIEDEASESRSLAKILHLASICGDLYSGGNLTANAEQLRKLGESYFGMDVKACQILLAEIQEQVPTMTEVLGLTTKDPAVLAQIRVKATEYLVKESMALNEQMRAVSSDVARLETENSALEQRATTDPLTGLRNRGCFDETLQGELDRAHQRGHTVGLILVDIDHFKSVNDTYGHRIGDEMLKAIARALREKAGDDECAARYGGEELALICSEVSVGALRERAESIRSAIEAITVQTSSGPLQRTASLGACVSAPGPDPACLGALVEATDAELYRAKADGRNRVYITSLGD